MTHLLCFGYGFSARALAGRLRPKGWRITGTCRSAEKADALEREGVTALAFDGTAPIADLKDHITEYTHVLLSVPPDDDGDPVWRLHGADLVACARHIPWLGYLSTTGVYGDRQGGWVDEDSDLTPATRRGNLRVKAERQWFHAEGLPVHVFRLAGIYGPGRNPLARVMKGTARRVVKPGQVFSRIHVDDIAQVLDASIARPNPGTAYNVCDDLAAPPQDVIAHAAELLGKPVPPDIPFDEADMSPMGLSFYAESKRVRNDRIKGELGIELLYPDYKVGLEALKRREFADV